LLSLQNEDGGWSASAGLASNTEATSLGCLAAHTAGSAGSAARERAAEWLVRQQRADGSWAFIEGLPAPSWSTSLAVLALGRTRADEQAVRRALRWLVGQEGTGPPFLIWLSYKLFPERQLVELNPSFRGWPWAPGTFGFVEPTSYAVVAFKALSPLAPRRRARERIRDAERMLLDRVCAGGGWNYGNTRVLDVDLEPFPDTTALALIALQGRPLNERMQTSFARLEEMLRSNDSGLTLALSILCYRLYERDTAPLIARLEQRFKAASFLGETRTLALATLALADQNVFQTVDHA
jgi:hypothetical protein